MIFGLNQKTQMPSPDKALPGRPETMEVPPQHFVNQHPMLPPYPIETESVLLGLGCFWGAERKFWQQAGVYVTAVGYSGGFTPNPSYEELCSGKTGHAEVVQVVYEPTKTNLETLLKVFFESHDPTQGMRQGNDTGTQYRSVIYLENPAHLEIAKMIRDQYQIRLNQQGFGPITTEIQQAPVFYYAEPYHQQYLAKNPNGYCGLGGTGVCFN